MQNTGSMLIGFKKKVYPWIKRLIFAFIALMFILNLGFLSPQTVHAAADLTITPITWNVIGLDSNNVNVGPDTFPVGARVCNTGDAVTDDLVATFVWDSTAVAPDVDYINLRNGSLNPISLPGLSAGTPSNPSCFDFYFEVTVTRDPAAYDTSRFYHIEVESAASTPEFTSLSTPTPRELYIEHLISQNRNSTDNVSYALFTDPATPLVDVPPGGTMSLMVGNTYAIRLDASTATQGYNQLEAFINFPNTIFQVLSVDSTYTADSSGYVANTSDKLYADACYWDMDPTSETYLSCIGSDGKVGGTISTTYIVKIISIGDAGFNTLNTLIYDFSGSSFHYNSDFSSSSRVVSISSSLSMTKAFSPTAINAGGTSTMSISITNTGDIDMTDVDMTDVLPTGLIVATPPNASAPEPNCISPIFSPAADATSVTYSGGVAANSTCVISVDVTAASNGTYVNTTNPLLINAVDTGITATANLQVEDIPAAGVCASPVTIAQWTIPDITAPPIATINNTGGTAVAFTNSGQHSIDSSRWVIEDASLATSVNIAADPYFGFQLTTSDFTDINMTFNYIRGSDGAQHLGVYYGNSATISTINPINPILFEGTNINPSDITELNANLDFTGKTNSEGDTFFFLYPYLAANSGGNAWIGVGNITFTGCPTTAEIDKVFSPNPISTGDTSTLTFTLTNYAGTAASVAFSDTFPAGMEVATTAAASQCSGLVNAEAGSSTISLTGGTIPGSGSCTVSVEVTTSEAGTFPNTSGYLSVNGSVVNSFASDTLIVLDPPSISKVFSPNPIYTGETSTLTFTITNPNPDTALTGVAFSDVFPPNLTVDSAPSLTQCGGSVTYDTNSISLSGGTISGGGSCTVSVDVTASLVGEYKNTSGNVTSTNAGTGNTASDTLVVQTTQPGISILKEVATSSNGPWSAYLNVIPGGDVYYRLIVENTGDVPLTSINITDITSPVNTAVETAITECIWPDVLPVASETQDPTATCIIGPFTVVDGTILNTATAHGTYSETEFDSSPSTATYATTELILEKTAVEDQFTQAGDLINYTYTITNIGATLNGSLTIDLFDTNTPVVCTVDLTISEEGRHDGDGNFDEGESFTCSAAYTVTAFDVSVGSITNTAYATVTPTSGGSVRTNMDRETVFSNKPDLIVTKTNNVGGYAMTGNQFDWTLKITNQGPLSAEFGSGSLIFSDQLQAGPTYELTTINPSEIAGITCAINGSLLLTCSTTQAVSIGEKGGYFTVGVGVTPSSTASLINIARVDPNNEILEGDEGNNQGSDALNVVLDPNTYSDLAVTKTDGLSSINASGTATTSYSIRVTNNGPDTVTNAVLKDTLGSGINATGVTCSVAASNQCVSNPVLADLIGTDGITLPALANGAFFELTLTVDVTATSGSITNTVTVTLPGGTIDSNLTNNTASDVDTINPVADLEVTKTDGTTSIDASGTATTSYIMRVTNNGPSSVTNAVLKDILGLGLSATNVTCSATASNQCVSNPVLADLIGTDGITLPALANGEFYELTLTVDVTATSGSVTNTVTVTPPTGTTDPNLSNNTDSDVDIINPVADLVVTKNDGITSIDASGTATTSYTIRVTNYGPSSVTNAVLKDTLGLGLSATSVTCSATASNQCVSNPVLADLIGTDGITLPALANGSFYELSLAVDVTATSGSVTNSVTVTPPSGTTDPNLSNNTDSDVDTINPSADLVITKNNEGDSINENGTTIYTIRVTNNGPSSVAGAVLVDNLPIGLDATAVICSTASGNQCSSNPVLADLISSGIVLPVLADGQFYEIELTATVTASSGSITNSATVTMPDGISDPTPVNNTDSDPDTVISAPPNADIEVTKSNGVNNVIVNSTTTYTIRVFNHGPDEVTGVLLEDTLGLGLDATTVVCSSVINNQCSIDPNLSDLLSTGIILPTLASNQFYEVRLTAIVATTSGTVTNNVSITVPETVIDPDPSNNSDDDEDQVITEYKLYLPLIARIIPVTETWNAAVGMEDLRLDSGNDFDYNDWLVNIGTTFNYTSSTKENVNSISFEFTPLARGASYDHEYKLNFPANTFANNAVVSIQIFNQDHQLIQTRTEMLNAAVENTYQIFAKTSAVLPGKSNVYEGSALSSPQQYAYVTIVFENATPFNFIPEETYDAHGSNLFYRTILHVLNTGEEITMGDIRTLVIPTNNWAWPEERIRIDLAYPNVSFIPGISPNFIFPNLWWNTPNQCVVDGLSCPKSPADLIYFK